MKNGKVFKCAVIFFILGCIALLIMNKHKDDWFPSLNTVGVQIVYMMQDPESGEYQRSVQKSFMIEKGQPYQYEPRKQENYEVNLGKSYLSSESVVEPTEFTVYYDCELCNVTFSANGGEIASGAEYQIQTIRKGQSISNLPQYEKLGYDHVGFSPSVQKVYEDTDFAAVWEISVYNVYLYVIDGSNVNAEGFEKSNYVSNSYSKSFDFTMDFALPTPTHESSEYIFNGWNTKADGSGEYYSDVAKETYNDLRLYAIYNVQTYKIGFMLGEEEYTSAIAIYGSKIYAPKVNPNEQIAGYGLNWYADQNFTELYNFTTMPSGGATVYGKWEEDTGAGFIGWSPEGETIDSYEELEKFVDYVRFYNVTTENYKLEVTYTTSQETITNDLVKAIELSDFRCGYEITYGFGSYEDKVGKAYAICFCSESNLYEYQLLSTEANDYKVYEYLGYAETGRGSDYTDFYIEKLPISQQVETTNQLLYVVEHGYKPVCKENSPAETVYNKAKEVLNKIIKEDYNDYQKVEAIYNWLVMNVQYDHNALASEVANNWPKYDAFYMEGVFNKGKAVCDGIAKSFVLLSNIEGIPCVEVSGNKHAWCKVKINNQWYVADATQGNIQIQNSKRSIMSHDEFLISDAQKQLKGYTTGSYPLIKATGSYDYFGNKTFVIDGETYNYKISNFDQLTAFLKHVWAINNNLSYVSVDFENGFESETAFKNEYVKAKTRLMNSNIYFKFNPNIIGELVNGCVEMVFVDG